MSPATRFEAVMSPTRVPEESTGMMVMELEEMPLRVTAETLQEWKLEPEVSVGARAVFPAVW
jgi:hypothetical protein